MDKDSISIFDQVVDLLNDAAISVDEDLKCTNINIVKELIINKDSNLLDNFLEEILAFQTDRSIKVKKSVISFIEEACKKDHDQLAKVMGHVCAIYKLESTPVNKRIILAMTVIYPISIEWIYKQRQVDETVEDTWNYVRQLKSLITSLIDCDNDGLRTHGVKFMESTITTLTPNDPDYLIDANTRSLCHFCVDNILHKRCHLLDPDKMITEGEEDMALLLVFMGSPHISSVNLMTCMSTVTAIAKRKPQFLSRIIRSFESLHVNLPPTLSNSQVSSVRKNMKLQMCQLLRLTVCYVDELFSLRDQIISLLNDLGVNALEKKHEKSGINSISANIVIYIVVGQYRISRLQINKHMPKDDINRKRKAEQMKASREAAMSEIIMKKPKLDKKKKITVDTLMNERTVKELVSEVIQGEDDDIDIKDILERKLNEKKNKLKIFDREDAIKMTSDDLAPRFTNANVADLVLISMVFLPDEFPPTFQSTYTPIAEAGSSHQIDHISRLLATQLTSAKLGVGWHKFEECRVQKLKELQEQIVSTSIFRILL